MKFGKPTRIRRIRTSSSSGAKKNRGARNPATQQETRRIWRISSCSLIGRIMHDDSGDRRWRIPSRPALRANRTVEQVRRVTRTVRLGVTITGVGARRPRHSFVMTVSQACAHHSHCHTEFAQWWGRRSRRSTVTVISACACILGCFDQSNCLTNEGIQKFTALFDSIDRRRFHLSLQQLCESWRIDSPFEHGPSVLPGRSSFLRPR
jgi:hypothetical protein